MIRKSKDNAVCFKRLVRLAAVAGLMACWSHSLRADEGDGAQSIGVGENRSSGVEVLLDQPYSANFSSERTCDVYLPAQSDNQALRPAVLVVHGGGWTGGDKWTTSGYAKALAKQGYVVVNLNYRLAPEYQFPAQVDDLRNAIIWTAEQAGRFAIDLDRLGLFGYSAGGHLCALIGVLADEQTATLLRTSNWRENDPRWEKLPKVHAVCAGGPPCDFRGLPPKNTTLAYFLGGSRQEKPTIYSAASPAAHASADDPAMQIIHGEVDLIVPPADSQRLFDALKACGARCRYEVIQNQGHMVTFLHPKTQETMLSFFRDMFAAERSSGAGLEYSNSP